MFQFVAREIRTKRNNIDTGEGGEGSEGVEEVDGGGGDGVETGDDKLREEQAVRIDEEDERYER